MKRVFDDRRANIVGHLSIDKLSACLQSYGAQDLSQQSWRHARLILGKVILVGVQNVIVNMGALDVALGRYPFCDRGWHTAHEIERLQLEKKAKPGACS